MTDYREEKMNQWKMNIDEFKIGESIIDNDGLICIINNKTSNSIEVFIEKKTIKGIDCFSWFNMNDFNKRFKKID